MSTPIIPSHKIKGKHKLDLFIRDTYAGYGNTVAVPLKTTTEDLHKKASVNITYKKQMGKRDDYYRYYYYKTYTQKKPERFFASSHPVFMQRKHKGDK
jgi:hypothetical protein